jgi:hypothetical protein
MSFLALLAVGAILQSAAWALWTISIVAFGVFVVGVLDVVRLAVLAPLRGRRYSMVLVGAVAVIVLVGGLQPVKAHVVEPLRSPTITMAPTLEPGDPFFVDKRPRALKRGDVVVFRVPWTQQMLRVKRAVALAGDSIEMAGGRSVCERVGRRLAASGHRDSEGRRLRGVGRSGRVTFARARRLSEQGGHPPRRDDPLIPE